MVRESYVFQVSGKEPSSYWQSENPKEFLAIRKSADLIQGETYLFLFEGPTGFAEMFLESHAGGHFHWIQKMAHHDEPFEFSDTRTEEILRDEARVYRVSWPDSQAILI